MSDCDVVIVGAGVIGLATGAAFAQLGRDVLILEAENHTGAVTSSRNSGVIHAGLYYAAGSLKARLCIEGREKLYAFARAHGVAHKQTGKLVVANGDHELEKLAALHKHAMSLGVPLDWLSSEEACAMEGEVQADAALWSVRSGIVDQHELMDALEGVLTAHGGQVVLNTPVRHFESHKGTIRVHTSGDTATSITANLVINAAGLWAQQLATASGYTGAPKLHYAKGHYFALSGKSPFSRLVYPLHTSASLGLHACVDLGGQCRFGPDVGWVDQIDYDVPEDLKDKFVSEVAKYWPGVVDALDRLSPDYAGVRPKLVGPGEPSGDFTFHTQHDHGMGNIIHLFGIESPGLTSCLAVADHVVQLAEQA